MSTLSRYPMREARLFMEPAKRAFTLIELLTVIAIITILVAISFGAIKGVRQRASINQAKAELSSIAQALEAYKFQYGDYPHTSTAANKPDPDLVATRSANFDAPCLLFNALTGQRGPQFTAPPISGKSFLEISRYKLQDPAALPASGAPPVYNALLDPWGNRYLYYYKTGDPASWTRTPGYVLFSAGPDGLSGIDSVDATGAVSAAPGSNAADDIHANK